MKSTGILVVWLMVGGAMPVSTQNPCLECFKTADQDLKKCLEQAISEEDKIGCADKRDEQTARCDHHDCQIERDDQKVTTERERS